MIELCEDEVQKIDVVPTVLLLNFKEQVFFI